MNAFVQPYADDDFTLLAINVQEPYAVVQGFIEGLGGVSYPVLLDSAAEVFGLYQFQTNEAYAPFPRQLVIDKQGVVQYLAAEHDPEATSAVIDALLSP